MGAMRDALWTSSLSYTTMPTVPRLAPRSMTIVGQSFSCRQSLHTASNAISQFYLFVGDRSVALE